MKCKIFKENIIVNADSRFSLKRKLISIPIDNHSFFITMKNDEFILNVKSELGTEIIYKSKDEDKTLNALALIEKQLKLHFIINKIKKVFKILYLGSFPVLIVAFILSINGIAQNFMYQQNIIAQTQADNVTVQENIVDNIVTHDNVTNDDSAKMLESLKKAAETKKFTVSLSSGKEHTLYVFSDPLCPYCQKIEPKLHELAKTFNVEIFPVSVIGGDNSEKFVSQVLSRKDNERVMLWKELMTGNGIPAVDANYTQFAELVKMNNLAFSMFGFDGTPTVLSENGYQIPQSLFGDAEKLSSLIKGQ